METKIKQVSIDGVTYFIPSDKYISIEDGKIMLTKRKLKLKKV